MSDTAINPINIPSLQPKNQVNFQQNPSYTQPPMQGTGSEQIRQSVDNSYLANRAKASGDATPEQLLPFWLASWYGLGQLMDKFNPLCRGEYKDSILGKIGGWGDKVSTETRVGRGIEHGLQWIDNKTTALAKKNKIVNALKNYSTRPEWSFAKTPGAGVHGFLATDTEQLFENFLNPLTNRQVKSPLFGIPLSAKSNYYQGLEQYGNITQQEINNFVKSLKGKTFAEKTLALQKKELELLGANADIVAKIEGKTGLKGLEKLAKSLKVKKLGFKSIREFNELKGKFLDNPDKIMKALENADKKIKFSVWRGNDNILGKIKSHLIGRIATPQEYLNKYKAVLGKGNTSRLGRFLPASLGWLTEGTTSRFAGGKLAVAMQSYFLADMLYHTIKAPKGEKTKTFAERFVNDFTYFMAMTFGIKAMHKVGGLKYLGIKDKAGIEAYRKGVEVFKAKHAAGLLKNKKAYKFAQKRLDVLLGKQNVKGFFNKLFFKVGKLINLGNERIPAYKSTSKYNLNWLRKCANGNILGVPLRFAIPMLVISPFLAKLTTKTAHKIFGKPTNSVLDEDKEPEEVKTAQQQTQPQNNNIPEVNKPQQPPRNPNQYADSNLIKQRTNAINGQQQVNNVNPQQATPNATNPNVAQPTKENEEKEPVRTYIPSPVGMVPQTPDMSGINQAMSQADAAEKYANSVLKMS
ncbi:MAG TPA: hypothetical protein DCS44_02135 [Cyanobacteria bacterium UBA10660]|nr:MAG TPA: hypothetical protein CPT83_04785 [Candidatus Gastranaerophilales bacterium HUM_1]HAS93399.1 hypothetical protein [Cyanobacteria bacterium UBA10660]